MAKGDENFLHHKSSPHNIGGEIFTVVSRISRNTRERGTSKDSHVVRGESSSSSLAPCVAKAALEASGGKRARFRSLRGTANVLYK